MNEPAANSPHNLAQLFHERDVECQQLTALYAQSVARGARLAAALEGLSAARDFTLPDDIKRDIQEAQNCE